MIQSVSHDQLSYASGADAVRWNLTFEYEGINYQGFEEANAFAAGSTRTDPGGTVQTAGATQAVTVIDGGEPSIVRDRNGNPVVDSSGNPVVSGRPLR